MSEWITDRRPTAEDVAPAHGCVFDESGHIVHHALIMEGEPWKPIPKCAPYVKPRRFYAWWDDERGWWMIERDGQWFEWLMRLDKQNDECREAAERIADVYEVVMP